MCVVGRLDRELGKRSSRGDFPHPGRDGGHPPPHRRPSPFRDVRAGEMERRPQQPAAGGARPPAPRPLSGPDPAAGHRPAHDRADSGRRRHAARAQAARPRARRGGRALAPALLRLVQDTHRTPARGGRGDSRARSDGRDHDRRRRGRGGRRPRGGGWLRRRAVPQPLDAGNQPDLPARGALPRLGRKGVARGSLPEDARGADRARQAARRPGPGA